jgi:hypothetical protein
MDTQKAKAVRRALNLKPGERCLIFRNEFADRRAAQDLEYEPQRAAWQEAVQASFRPGVFSVEPHKHDPCVCVVRLLTLQGT